MEFRGGTSRGRGGDWEGLRLERVDPGGVISSAIEAHRVVGSSVYFSTEITAPGVIQHIEGNRIPLANRMARDSVAAAGLRMR